MSERSHGLIAAILCGGIVAATIDIGAACLITGRSIPFILHTIAGGILGKQSFSGGLSTAVLGLLLQEAMGVIIAAIYVLAAQPLPVLRRRWIVFGLAYGLVIFFVMNYVVVPLSAWRHWPVFSAPKFLANLAAMLLFGLIVAYFAARRTGGSQT
jgi:predicted Abi (CAAX) family protease